MTTEGRWQDMFDNRRSGRAIGAPPLMAAEEVPREEPADDTLDLDLSVYKPWVLQRGRSRPPMMLDFRRYEPRSGMWSGSAIAYPTLLGMQYTSDRIVSLDFSKRQVVLEGHGLDELVRYIQQGSVTAVQEYAARLWPERPSGPIISAIRLPDAPR